MITTVDAQTFRNSLGDMINQAQYRRDGITITRNGCRVAALINMSVSNNMREIRAGFAAVGDRLAEHFRDIEEEDGIEHLKSIAAKFRT